MARWLWATGISVVAIIVAAGQNTVPRASAAGVVTSCTEAAFDAAIAGGGTVTFACSGTITFTSTKTIVPGTSLTLDGSDQHVMLSGGGTVRHFIVLGGGTLHLRNVSLSNGRAPTGGAIFSGGSLFVSDTVFASNIATSGYGGAISNAGGDMVIERGRFMNNSAELGGGAISSMSSDDHTVTISASMFDNNGAVTYAGAILNLGGVMEILGSTFSGNHATYGGAIFQSGRRQDGTLIHTEMRISNSTFTGNTTPTPPPLYGTAGAIVNNPDAVLAITSSSFKHNFSGLGGEILNAGRLTLTNTVMASSKFGLTCVNFNDPPGSLLLTDGGGNLVEDGSCGFAKGEDPQLGPLAENGGPTRTMAIPRTSPAFNTGVRAVCDAPTPGGAGGLDQRRFPRVTCSAGAYEPLPDLRVRKFAPGIAGDRNP